MTPQLKISPDLTLPANAVTKTFAIIAQRRKGKTYTASVMAEEMVAATIPWVALDPTGAWWGLRSSADGKKAGLPVYVFGGDHGDLPLERTAGKVIADLVVDHPGWYILDFSHFESKEAERQLATDFAERFYRRKGQSKTPVHLFVDEADMFAPQRTPSGDQRMLGAFESIVRRGGIRGIGTTLITQRAAVLNKNVLEQIDVLIALRTVGPNDRKAIAGYVEANGTPEQQAELMGSIASLDLGEAWVWEPGEDLFRRVKIRERRTYNSSATPDSSVPTLVTTLAPVDLEKLRNQMAATIERVEADDPKVLKQRIAELEKRTGGERIVEVEKPYPVEVSVLTEDDRRLIGSVLANIEDLEPLLRRVVNAGPKTPTIPPRLKPEKVSSTTQAPKYEPLKKQISILDPSEDIKLSGAEKKILSVLAQYGDRGRTTTQVAILTGYSSKGGGFRNALGSLRTKGLIDRTDPIHITGDGTAALGGDREPLPQGEGLFEHWMAKLSKAESRALAVLHDAYPHSLTASQVAERAGYEAGGGGFRNALGKLRTLELISGYGELQISDMFFEEVKA